MSFLNKFVEKNNKREMNTAYIFLSPSNHKHRTHNKYKNEITFKKPKIPQVKVEEVN